MSLSVCLPSVLEANFFAVSTELFQNMLLVKGKAQQALFLKHLIVAVGAISNNRMGELRGIPHGLFFSLSVSVKVEA